MTLDTIRQVTEECIDYIEQNAVWLGVVCLAVLILLLLFGGIASARRSRRQTKALRRIDRKMEQLLAAKEADAAAREALAEDVSAIRESVAGPETIPTYAQTVEAFFADTQVEECGAEDICEADEAEPAAGTEEVAAAAAEETPEAPEESAPEEAEAPAGEAAEEPAQEETETPAEEAPLEPAFPDLKEALLGGATARGKSGRLYTREELETQIRK